MYQSSANFRGSFWLKGKSCKTLDIIISTKLVFFKFQFWGFWGRGAATWQPPPPLGCALADVAYRNQANRSLTIIYMFYYKLEFILRPISRLSINHILNLSLATIPQKYSSLHGQKCMETGWKNVCPVNVLYLMQSPKLQQILCCTFNTLLYFKKYIPRINLYLHLHLNRLGNKNVSEI
jgi:hypothetical protein